MHLTCPRQELSRGLSLVGHAVSSRSTLPILANVLLATEHDRLKLAATNLEIGITTWVDATILEEGTTTLPAKLFTELVSTLSSEQIDLVKPVDTHTVHFQTTRSQASLRGLSPEEFPAPVKIEDGDLSIDLNPMLLKEVIASVAYAAADDDSRPVLTGVLVRFGPECITFAAADSFRLAERSMSFPGAAPDCPDLLIPARTLKELTRLLPDAGTVTLRVAPQRSQVLFHTHRVELASRLLEGTFPTYQAIIPQGYRIRMVVETSLLAHTIKAAALFARESAQIVTFKVSAETKALTIEAQAEDMGEHVSTLDAHVEGEGDITLHLNVQYLADVLETVKTAEVAFEFTSSAKPIAIKPVGPVDALHIVMPMHVNR